MKIERWERYRVENGKFCLTVNVKICGRLCRAVTEFYDFDDMKVSTRKSIGFRYGEKIIAAPSCEIGDGIYTVGRSLLCSVNNLYARKIFGYARGFGGLRKITYSVKAQKRTDLFTPSGTKDDFFVYETACLPAKGTITVGRKKYSFEDGLQVMISRGKAPVEDVKQYSALLQTALPDGTSFGILLADGSEENKYPENALFYDGKTYELSKVVITETENGKLRFKNSDETFNVNFEPISEKRLSKKIRFFDKTHTYGYFGGTVKLDDGNRINLKGVIGSVQTAKRKR